MKKKNRKLKKCTADVWSGIWPISADALDGRNGIPPFPPFGHGLELLRERLFYRDKARSEKNKWKAIRAGRSLESPEGKAGGATDSRTAAI